MKKKLLYLVYAAFLVSCDGSQFSNENLFPEEYHKVISIRENDEKLLTISDDNSRPLVEKVLVNKTGSIAYYEAEAELHIQSQDRLEASLGHAVENNYKVLPPETYKVIGNLDMHFSEREDAKDFEFVFYPEKIKVLPNEDVDGTPIVYVLQIELVSHSDALVNEKKKNMLWICNRNLSE